MDLEHSPHGSDMAPQQHASQRNIETLLRSRLAAVHQSVIAEALDINPSRVSNWVSGKDPVPLHRIGPLLDALGLVVLTREEHQGLRRWAARALLDGLEAGDRP